MKPLTPNQREALENLRFTTDNLDEVCGGTDNWARPLDCGGFNGSHHGQTLRRLAEKGLCDVNPPLTTRYRGNMRATRKYRINANGRAALVRDREVGCGK
jgi:hypothetical protein